jgi:hypothetical protein
VVISALSPYVPHEDIHTQYIELDFPFIGRPTKLKAVVEIWNPTLVEESPFPIDIALLTITDDIPVGAQGAPLRLVDHSWGRPIRVSGFPEDFSGGIWVSGKVLGGIEHGQVQLVGDQLGPVFSQGYSGSLVWCDPFQGVLGMLVQTAKNLDLRSATMISAATLARACPQLTNPQHAHPVEYEPSISLSANTPIQPEIPFLSFNSAASPLNSASKRISYAIDLLKEIKSRSIADWCSLGLTRAEANSLWEEGTGLDLATGFFNPSDEQIQIIEAEMGAGKTLVGRRLLQLYIEQFSELPAEAPIPVYLRSRPRAGHLENEIRNTINAVGDPQACGVVVVIDENLDANSVNLLELYNEAQLLVEMWPQTQFTILSRPIHDRTAFRTTSKLESLNPETAVGLIERLGGFLRFGRISDLPPILQSAAQRPLFAILIAQAFKAEVREKKPQSQGDLLGDLVNRVLAQQDATLKNNLTHLALSILERGGPILISELDDKTFSEKAIGNILKTGFVTCERKALSFNLDVLTAWFGALSLKETLPHPESFRDSEIRFRWFDALTMFIAQNSHERVFPYLKVIVGCAPAEAAHLIQKSMETGEMRALGEPIFAPPNWQESGNRLRDCMLVWADSLNPLLSLLIPTDADGTPTSLGVAVKDSSIYFGWQASSEYIQPKSMPIDRVVELPQELCSMDGFFSGSAHHTDIWQSIRWTHVTQYSSWAWELTLDQLRSKLSRLISTKTIPLFRNGVENTPLKREYSWAGLLALMNFGSFRTKPIGLDEVEHAINHYSTEGYEFVHNRGGRAYLLDVIKEEFLRLRNEGVDLWIPPYGCPDEYSANGWFRHPVSGEKIRPQEGVSVGSHWTDHYSEKGLVERTEKIWASALEGYENMVSMWFPSLASSLSLFASLPVKLVARLEHPSTSKGDFAGLEWYFESLPSGMATRYDFRSLSCDEKRFFSDPALPRQLREKRDKYRGRSSQSLPVTVYSRLISHSDLPATELAYEWLKSDLKHIGWIN